MEYSIWQPLGDTGRGGLKNFLDKNLCPKMSRSLGIWYIMFRKVHVSKGIGQ